MAPSSSSSSSSSEDDQDEEIILQMAVVRAAEASATWMASVISKRKEKETEAIDHWQLPRKKRIKWKHSEALQC